MPFLNLQSKADNLSLLETRLSNTIVLPQIAITYGKWKELECNLAFLIEKKGWVNTNLIIRSSAKNEDKLGTSCAGRYSSFFNKNGITEINDAVSKVFKSFDSNSKDNQVFIQPMISLPKIQGVAFNREPSSNNDYFVINYTHKNSSTDQITNGWCIDDEVIYIAKSYAKHPSPWVQKVIDLLLELEKIYQGKSLDIEFILSQENQLFLLQVRELYTIVDKPNVVNQEKLISQLTNKYTETKKQSPIYGIMPDWNPAEIIGLHPNTLALSLYKELITNEVWALSRVRYGYQQIEIKPLMIDFFGIPYIDVKRSFESFIPDGLPKEITNKLVSYYLNKLKKKPYLHDKIESKIIFSSSCFNIEKRLNDLQKHGFNAFEYKQIQKLLQKLTRNIIHPKTGHWQKDKELLATIVDKHQSIINSQDSIQNKIKKLITLCKTNGTLPFAGLARTAFIAKQYLISLEEIAVFSQKDSEMFNLSISTIVHDLITDFNKYNKSSFLSKFGHLRPDSYNLLSLRYDDSQNNYFDWTAPIRKESVETKSFKLSDKQKFKIEQLLISQSIPYNCTDFITFLKQAICNREHAKFLFSILLSDILALCEKYAQQENIKKENIVYLEINQITSNKEPSFTEYLIQKSKEVEKIRNSFLLPSLITKLSDFYYFRKMANQPNFITLKSVKAQPIFLSEKSTNIQGSIVLIKHADPGYDWIFTHKIKGLVTMYGGCNSHMAIRTAELNLPAVIGVGEKAFNTYIRTKLLYIDCKNKWIKIVK